MNYRANSSQAAQAGATFEADIEVANRFYALHHQGAVLKIPTATRPVGRAQGKQIWQPAEKTGCDYIGVYRGIPVAIEAKSTGESTRFPLMVHNKPRIQPHQVAFLQEFEASGGKAFILIRFQAGHVFRLRIEDYLKLEARAASENRASLPFSWMADFPQIERKGYVLDYLAGLERED